MRYVESIERFSSRVLVLVENEQRVVSQSLQWRHCAIWLLSRDKIYIYEIRAYEICISDDTMYRGSWRFY